MLATACLPRFNIEKYLKVYSLDSFKELRKYRDNGDDKCAQFVRDWFNFVDCYYFFIPLDKIGRDIDLNIKGISKNIETKKDLLEDWLKVLKDMNMPFEVITNEEEYKDLFPSNVNTYDFYWGSKENTVVIKMNVVNYLNGFHTQVAWNILRYIYITGDHRYRGIVKTFYDFLHKDIGLDLYQKISLAASIGPIVTYNHMDAYLPETYDYYQHCPTLPFKLFTLKEFEQYIKTSKYEGAFPFFNSVCKFKTWFDFKVKPELKSPIGLPMSDYTEKTKFILLTYHLFHTNQLNKILEAYNNDKGYSKDNPLSYD